MTWKGVEHASWLDSFLTRSYNNRERKHDTSPSRLQRPYSWYIKRQCFLRQKAKETMQMSIGRRMNKVVLLIKNTIQQ